MLREESRGNVTRGKSVLSLHNQEYDAGRIRFMFAK